VTGNVPEQAGEQARTALVSTHRAAVHVSQLSGP
jgi:hypothetical protein